MSFEQIDIHQAKALIGQGQVTVVDIRDPDSFKEARIAGALAINDANIEEFLKTANKGVPVICYCYHGNRSQGAAEYFAQSGFEKVYSLKGGFESWRACYEFVSSKE